MKRYFTTVDLSLLKTGQGCDIADMKKCHLLLLDTLSCPWNDCVSERCVCVRVAFFLQVIIKNGPDILFKHELIV